MAPKRRSRKTTPDRGAAEPSGKSIEELRKESRKERQEGPSEERQEGSSRKKAGRRRGAKAMERLLGHLTGPGGGGVPRLGGTCRGPGEGVDIKQHRVRKELLEGPTRKQQENGPRSKEPKSNRKDPKKESDRASQKKEAVKESLRHQGTQNRWGSRKTTPGTAQGIGKDKEGEERHGH